MAISDRGFASMDKAKQREIASKGGKAAHAKGTAHQWDAEEARRAGRIGGNRHSPKQRALRRRNQLEAEARAAAKAQMNEGPR